MNELHIGSRGGQVKALQIALNARARPRGLPIVLVDGEVGRDTEASADRVCRALGALERTLQGERITVGMQRMARYPHTRTPRQRVRARQRAAHNDRQAVRQRSSVVSVSGNLARGGILSERIVAAARRALELDVKGLRQSFYSQVGRFTMDHAITGEKAGERSDCSQGVIGWHESAGADVSEGRAGGYTGTLAKRLRKIPRAVDGCTIIWDAYGPQGHTAICEDAKRSLCIGHGSRHVARHGIGDFSYKGPPGYYVAW